MPVKLKTSEWIAPIPKFSARSKNMKLHLNADVPESDKFNGQAFCIIPFLPPRPRSNF